MPVNGQTQKARLKAAQQKQKKTNQIAAYIGIGVILALVIWVVFSNLSSGKKTADSPSTPVEVINTPSEVGSKQYSSAPPMLIDVTKQYFANVKMANGSEFVIQLFADKAPITVNSFVFLARDGYFDGVTFHRVLEGFMAQGGDPTGSGMSGPGYQFVNEDNDLGFDKAGVVAMANAGRDTNGSQFFITFAPVERLNGGYTIFGQVVSGMDSVNAITRRDPETNPDFAGDAIESISITEK